MVSCGWQNCPRPTRQQVEGLVNSVAGLLADNLLGMYLHGSLAMGCFNPDRSDIDLLVIVQKAIALAGKRSLIELLMHMSLNPHPLEISFVRHSDLTPWQYPTPFDLHYSEEWRGQYCRDLEGGGWRRWDDVRHRDPDLAAHITIARTRGICLLGDPAARVLPVVPRRDYLASIRADLEWALGRVAGHPVYGVLNACRVLAYIYEGHVYSKVEGGEWGLRSLPLCFHPAIRAALAVYRGTEDEDVVSATDAAQLLEYALDAPRCP